MSHTINLTQEHQAILIESLMHSLNDKRFVVIKDQSKFSETQRQYEDAAEKLLNPVRCGSRQKNLFTWIQDQLLHSPSIVDTELVQRAIIICRYAADNQYTQLIKRP